MIFLLFGVLSEFFLTDGRQFFSTWGQHLLKDDLVGASIFDWKFFPEHKYVGFSLRERQINYNSFITPDLKKKYHVDVGIRRKTELPIDQGIYDIMIGPYDKDWNQNGVEKELSDIEATDLQGKCIEFVVFGLDKIPSIPFDAGRAAPLIFDRGFACDE